MKPDNSKTLKGISVLVTRPAHQAQPLIENLRGLGATTISLPTIEIEFTCADITPALNSDLLIFTSVNSVHGAQHALQPPWNYTGKIAAVGKATASALEQLNLSVDIVPPTGAGTESLLVELEPYLLEGTRAIIIRGDTGRETLFEQLSKRKLQVSYLCVYHRALPAYDQAHINHLVGNNSPDIISVTSDLGLTNLLQIIPTKEQAGILRLPLVVNSERCATLAREYGFHGSIGVANPPGDAAQVTEILRLTRQ